MRKKNSTQKALYARACSQLKENVFQYLIMYEVLPQLD